VTTRIVRRDLLKGLSLFTVTAVAPGALVGCSSGDEGQPAGPPPEQAAVYPQGIASGDPKPDSVMLWTRALPVAVGTDLPVHFEIATDQAFAMKVAEGDVTATAAADYTLRIKVEKLSAYTTYYYRFTANGVASVVGRTKTAPKDDQDVSPRFAFASCQDFNGRYYHAYTALLAEKPEPDFILHLGDYVYETEGDPRFQGPTDKRVIVIKEGIDVGEGGVHFKAARTLADYRSLYQQYRSDPILQKVHAMFPFVNIWDDHEFADDCWQDHSTAFNDLKGDEKDPARRHAASRAWFEYQPADVTFDDAAAYPKDIKIYRAFRWGKHVEIFLTDQRYYRSDHVIPEGPTDLDVGKLSKNSSVGARAFVLKKGFDPKEVAANPTMLGKEQLDWFTAAIAASKATWKIWGSETQLAQMVVNLKDYPVPDQYKDLFYLTTDQWDGFRTERKAVLTKLAPLKNVVVLTGDIHAFYASELQLDFDMPAKPIAVEYVVAGITSQSFQEIVGNIVEQSPTFKSLGLDKLVPQTDMLLQQAGPHYKFARSKANGVALVDVAGATEMKVTFLILKGSVTSPTSDAAVERVTFRTKDGSNTVEKV
jgi:alkaline phosphatase D